MTDSAQIVALEQAIERLGSQSAMARLLGLTQQSVSGWVNRGRPLPAEHVLAVEAATGISRHELRPDIYPIENPQSPQHPAGDMPAAVAEPPAAVGEPLSQSPGDRPDDAPAVSPEDAAGAGPAKVRQP